MAATINAARFAIEKPPVIIFEPISTWAISLKAQKIRTSYEMGWLERN